MKSLTSLKLSVDMASGGEKWLSPSAALTRFKPPEGFSAADTQPEERQQKARYGFLLGDIGLLIQQDTTSEVMEHMPVFPVPHMPYWQLGLINLRGNLVPVFDLKAFLDLDQQEAQSPQEKQWLMILERGEQAVGLYVDGLPRAVSTARPMNRLPPLPTGLRPHVTTAYVDDGVVWGDFDHKGLFRALAAQIAAGA